MPATNLRSSDVRTSFSRIEAIVMTSWNERGDASIVPVRVLILFSKLSRVL